MTRGSFFIGVVGLALAALAVCSASGLAAGGRTIADAPVVALGQEQVNTLNGIDFWRVPLEEGDQLTLGYGPQKSFSWMETCVLAPDVTDATVGNQPCYANKNVLQDDVMTLTARQAGLWTIALVPYPGCESSNVLNLRCSSGVAYHFAAYVKHSTRVMIHAPNIARLGSRVQIAGALVGGRGGVLVQSSWNGGPWATAATPTVGKSGSFAVRLRLRRTGTLRVRAVFPEAADYSGSAATTSTRVIR